jgi:signal transduction histidine kinase
VENILASALGQDTPSPAVAEKRDLLERLLARLAHEIRNPLSSLDIHVQLLEEDLGALQPETREHLSPRLEIIHGELHRLKTIVENFLRLTRPSALDLEPVELSRLVGHVCELLRPEAGARGIEIQTQVSTALPQLRADPVRLTQALLNLVINAMQAVGPKGQIQVRADLTESNLALSVSDNGPGIPADKQAAIFEPYFSTKPEGSGLGLWIAQQIATAHGGSLKAHNALGGGAVFTMLLPLQAPEISAGV